MNIIICHVTMFRIVGKVFVIVWMVVVRICRSLTGGKRKKEQEGEEAPKDSTTTSAGEWKTDWEEWEGMEVKIEPTTPPLEEEVDLFQDMQPVIHSTKKIRLKRTEQETPNLRQFAVDPAFKKPTAELLDWSDEECNEGWGEDEECGDLPELLHQSRQELRKQRQLAKERERERQKNNTNSIGLGATKIT